MRIRRLNFSDLRQVVLLYCGCFTEAPWFECFDPEEVWQEFVLLFAQALPKKVRAKHKERAEFLVCENEGQIVGAAIGFPMAQKPDVATLVTTDTEHTFYFSELFVSSMYRKQGVAKALIRARMKKARARGFTHGVVRTSIAQSVIQHLYVDELGFSIVATQEVTSTKVIDGVKQDVPDTRVIMAGKI
ncbi:hypothetical protein A3E97_01390 [Candidatus Uhrbacteria bacterium RIFCSPHIGHO2_12_FULL_47_12]|uniref:N-acetyltransferase domain-containing protein n=1 Tax=Candidatus Uhrbacteria bacterium RIFCSPLOWO2_02_FULL_48_18 TaxID=1802408 RepID=A0A1F7VDS4_9BACT|nr:MAG: hypothetical protein A2839_05280 [Candidatus Uhrbacteria bacterium RIFCSPHIGHO2_01_FULL_47_10]OGL76738.1 MAG: hypothetical protein A3E97_01390 [Candidatus Uhrbacteria bacterium RIFCSPHIGHO2_12_FULL_47_12]OGL80693.1 MAG: hypothetical protein A3B20_04860 [Candidatus Uhrbacteria bacterium RIFCSPLOWO2_01_FULL_47_17]OGL88124.1 MAG: hypothetical protein A3I41_00120 [Candidatus Uhrbacteria bacterium RIFCSPLOWO2_02_FULL_48_18]OGL92144.1 MAG: hypothetical protein A3H12_01670 [Candidatus Uhrbacte